MKYDKYLINIPTIIIIGILSLIVSNVFASSVNLSWNPSISTGVKGYKIHYGKSSGNYDTVIDAGNVLTYTVPNLIDTIDYYFVATAYNSTNESAMSNEVILKQAKTFNIGVDTVLPEFDSDNGGMLLATKVQLLQDATIRSLSFYVTNTAGKLTLAIYDSAFTKKAETLVFTPIVGWNTIPVINRVKLSSGDYWIAYEPTSSGLSFVKQSESGQSIYTNFTGAIPSIFPSNTETTSSVWSFYATFETMPNLKAPTNFRIVP